MPCSIVGCKSKKHVDDRGGGRLLCDAFEAERQKAVDDVGSCGPDGEDEAQDEGKSDSEGGEQEHQIIVNELLYYA